MNPTSLDPSPWKIARVLLADMFHRSWIILTLGFVGALSLPVLILGALRAKGALIVEDPAMILIHFTFAQIMGMGFGASVLHAAGAPSRLFTLPLTNRTILLIQMVPATLLVIGQTMVSIWIQNVLFKLYWPLLGNALAFGMIFATFQSFMTLFQKSALLLPALGGALALESLWVKSRHGPIFSLPTHYWTTVSPLDWMVFATVLALCYAIGMHGIARARCGNEIQTRLLDYLSNAISNFFGKKPMVFQNAVQAQSWYEWNLKGLVFPIIVLMVVPTTAVLWLFTDNTINDLVEALRLEGWMMSAAAMIGGIIMGNMGLSDASMAMSPFLGTKPLATVPWSRLLLATAFRSLVWGVLIWVAVYLLVLGGRELAGASHMPEPFVWWHMPGRILAAWTAMTFGLCISLTGNLLHLKILGGLYCGWLVTVMLVGSLTPAWFSELFTISTLSGCGMVLFSLTLWAWGSALRRRMVEGRQAILAGMVVTTLVGMAGWQWAQGTTPPGATRIHHFLLVSGVLSLAVFPFAAAPLALASNRAR